MTEDKYVILQTNIVVLVWPGGIMSLKERRVRGDMIEVYRLLTGKEQIDSGQFFTLAQPHYSLRGHEKKVSQREIKIRYKEIFLQPESDQWMEQSPSRSCELWIGQQLQEYL